MSDVKMYVLVYVSYDYYRFQKNISASNDRGKLIKKVEELQSDPKTNFPLKTYIYEDGVRENNLRENGTAHYWIQKLSNNEKFIP